MVRVADFEDYKAQCADCEEVLLNFVRIRDSDKQHRFIIKCPLCEGESWVIELTGDYFQKPPNRLLLDDITEDEEIYIVNMRKRW